MLVAFKGQQEHLPGEEPKTRNGCAVAGTGPSGVLAGLPFGLTNRSASRDLARSGADMTKIEMTAAPSGAAASVHPAGPIGAVSIRRKEGGFIR